MCALDKSCKYLLSAFSRTCTRTFATVAHWVTPAGIDEIVTAPLDGTILEGVTRQAVIDILNEGDVKVTERKFTMAELCSAIDDGRIREVFSCGTAVTVTPIKEIMYQGELSEDTPRRSPTLLDFSPFARWPSSYARSCGREEY